MARSRLFHLSPRYNRVRIQREGLDPACSQGAKAWLWLCKSELLTWALFHVAKHHSCRVSDMDFWEVLTPESDLLKGRSGIFRSCKRIGPDSLRLL